MKVMRMKVKARNPSLIEWIYLENLSEKSYSYDPKDDELYLDSTKCFEKNMEVDRISNAQIDFLIWV